MVLLLSLALVNQIKALNWVFWGLNFAAVIALSVFAFFMAYGQGMHKGWSGRIYFTNDALLLRFSLFLLPQFIWTVLTGFAKDNFKDLIPFILSIFTNIIFGAWLTFLYMVMKS